jgi:hypothetical protein
MFYLVQRERGRPSMLRTDREIAFSRAIPFKAEELENLEQDRAVIRAARARPERTCSHGGQLAVVEEDKLRIRGPIEE